VKIAAMAGWTLVNMKTDVENEILELRPRDAAGVHEDTMRTFEAGPDGAVFVAVGVSGGPGDAITTQDGWTD
jgi:hypothetical protein